MAGVEPQRQAQGHETWVDGEAAAGGQGRALGAERRRAGDAAEEDKARIERHQGRRPATVGLHPGADRLHGYGVLGDLAPRHQLASDGDVGVAVVAAVAEAHDGAVLHHNAARPLDVEEEDIDGIVGPQDLQPPSGQGTLVDGGAAG